jgi:hypothetical protein
MYRMLQMGGLYHYYTLEYDVDCSSSTPISYDTTDSSLARPCACNPDVCCFEKPVGFGGRYKFFSKGDHVPDNNTKTHHADKDIPHGDKMDKHGQTFSGFPCKTKLNLEFTAKVDEGGGNVWWFRAGQFTCTPRFYDPMDVNVGYQVDEDPTPDVDSGHVTVETPDPAFPFLKTVKVEYDSTDPKSIYNGRYQILLAN